MGRGRRSSSDEPRGKRGRSKDRLKKQSRERKREKHLKGKRSSEKYEKKSSAKDKYEKKKRRRHRRRHSSSSSSSSPSPPRRQRRRRSSDEFVREGSRSLPRRAPTGPSALADDAHTEESNASRPTAYPPCRQAQGKLEPVLLAPVEADKGLDSSQPDPDEIDASADAHAQKVYMQAYGLDFGHYALLSLASTNPPAGATDQSQRFPSRKWVCTRCEHPNPVNVNQCGKCKRLRGFS
eukprot:GHVT01072619.1.p1 GENE.GHVT01072619.1~~GHVT01072619.1.p1  ORF type:complete len:237 (+),score=44.61 GHVT01072619.1:273-983(+)